MLPEGQFDGCNIASAIVSQNLPLATDATFTVSVTRKEVLCCQKNVTRVAVASRLTDFSMLYVMGLTWIVCIWQPSLTNVIIKYSRHLLIVKLNGPRNLSESPDVRITANFIMVVSCSVFHACYPDTRSEVPSLCGGEWGFAFSRVGWTLIERWRNLTVSQFFEWHWVDPANRKEWNFHQHVTGTCWHIMGKHCRTDDHYENSCVGQILLASEVQRTKNWSNERMFE